LRRYINALPPDETGWLAHVIRLSAHVLAVLHKQPEDPTKAQHAQEN